jgi:ATP-dependent Lon protease
MTHIKKTSSKSAAVKKTGGSTGKKSKRLESSQDVLIPILPLRDVVIFPNMVIPLFVGREKSILALDKASDYDKEIFVIAQKDPNMDEPNPEDLHHIGSIVTILQLLKLPDGTVKVLVEGKKRAQLLRIEQEDPCFMGKIQPLETLNTIKDALEPAVRTLMNEFEQYVKLNKKIPPEILTTLNAIDDPERLCDSITAHMSLKLSDKQSILATLDLSERLQLLIKYIAAEIEVLELESNIRSRVKHQVEKTQREYYLNEQMKAIQKELGAGDDGLSELDTLAKRIEESGMSKEAETKALAELNKLKAMPPMSAEATVSRNYLDTLISVPWKNKSEINKDLLTAEAILEKEHYGLKEVKERIVEYLAVQARVNKVKGPVLCLVGPPGVGKTSLGESIARATGRQFIRVSLGGVRDEAEIRGHRRTYIGALPGKIIQKMIKSGVSNPLFLLDEVDKMSSDFRGDPSSALLEVLDPEQNNTFNDHYLEVDYDLSDVMFVCTANTLNIPAPLLDRMEVIRLPGYTENEKMNIAERHLMPKQLELNGLNQGELTIPEETIFEIIRHYTREAGVRNLEREIAKLCRKSVRNLLSKKKGKARPITITPKNLEDYLGIKKFRYGTAEQQDRVGLVNGLAWTEVGGELLTIEGAVVPGKGKTTYTGRLGDVMQESIQAALTIVRGRANSWGIQKDFFDTHDIHVHVPEGATPKDGPSAGITMCTALVSALTNIPVKANVAMTGEITLRGEILPIGGLKEKLLAALRGGIKTVLIPDENKAELKQIPDDIKKGLEIIPVRWIDQVLAVALQRLPQVIDPLENTPEVSKAALELSKKKKAISKKSPQTRAH